MLTSLSSSVLECEYNVLHLDIYRSGYGWSRRGRLHVFAAENSARSKGTYRGF